MKLINIDNVKVKNILGIIEQPTYEDLLYEIVNFLCDEKQLDGEFKTKDVMLKTKIRINSEISEDLDNLVKLGYLEKNKYQTYRVIRHLWEK